MDATWLALAVVLTAIGAIWTVVAWRTRGVAAAVRGAGLTLLAPAAYLTGTLELAGEIAVDVGDWARGLVFSPVVWTGIALAGAGVLLVLLGGALAAKGVGTTPRTATPREVGEGAERRAVPPAGRRAAAPPATASGGGRAGGDDDLDDIEAILRRRGIS